MSNIQKIETIKMHLAKIAKGSKPTELTKFNPVIEGVQLSAAMRADRAMTASILIAHIEKLNRSIKTSRENISAQDVYDYVDWMTAKYWNIKIEEIILILTDMRFSGKYYGGLDLTDITERIDQYTNSEARAAKIEKHHLAFKQAETDERSLKGVDYDAYRTRVKTENEARDEKRAGQKRLTDEELIERFVAGVALQFGTTPEQMHKKCRERACTDARACAQHFQRSVLCWTLERIGKYWGQDHSTVGHGIKKAIDLGLVPG